MTQSDYKDDIQGPAQSVASFSIPMVNTPTSTPKAVIALTSQDINKLRKEGKDSFGQGDFSKALQSFSDGLQGVIVIHGKGHPQVAELCLEIGLCWLRLKDAKKAFTYMSKALDFYLRFKRVDCEEIEYANNQVAEALKLSCDYTGALRHLLQVFGSLSRRVGWESWRGLKVLVDIAEVYELSNNLTKAEEYYSRGAGLVSKIRLEDESVLESLYIGFGSCLKKQGKIKEAVIQYQKSLGIQMKLYGESSAKVLDTQALINSLSG